MKKWKAVPPTQYYLSMRAEWFRKEALRYRDMGDLLKTAELLQRASEYSKLAGELDYDTEGQHEERIHTA